MTTERFNQHNTEQDEKLLKQPIHAHLTYRVIRDIFNLVHDFHMELEQRREKKPDVDAIMDRIRALIPETSADNELSQVLEEVQALSVWPFDDYPLKEMERHHQRISDSMASAMMSMEKE